MSNQLMGKQKDVLHINHALSECNLVDLGLTNYHKKIYIE
jgi:hypothetical protein